MNMTPDPLAEKYLELIRKTKEFLQTKKTLEDALGVLSLVRKAGEGSKVTLPEKVKILIENSGGPESAEKLSKDHISTLHIRVDELASEIRKLSSDIEASYPVNETAGAGAK